MNRYQVVIDRTPPTPEGLNTDKREHSQCTPPLRVQSRGVHCECSSLSGFKLGMGDPHKVPLPEGQPL